ncbi:hypothetical protein PybrP1_005627 [[Pythium] brassicae (nom. inval.)]|nr:hypothetical protein PybrP1_005627 [[Pythium] brassicae (nom. inval.)]
MALDLYYRTTSGLRVVLVCVSTPLPALVFALLVELIPLQPPTAGSFGNWGFWLRYWATLTAMSLAGVWQVRVLIPELQFTTGKCLVAAFVSSSVHVGMSALFSHLTVFPVPFIIALGGTPGAAILCAAILVVLRIRPSAMDPEVKTQLRRFFRVVINCGVMMAVYPAYNALFVAASPLSQSALIIGLQLFKLAMKNAMARALRHLEDFMPEQVVFFVEVFNMMYLTTCMQTANAIHTVALIIGLDCAQSLWEIRAIQKHVSAMKSLIEQLPQSHSRTDNADFLETSLDDAWVLEVLQTQNIFGRGGRTWQPAFGANADKIKLTLLHDALQSLFHVEYVVLVEYVECIIPFIFICYSAVRINLPSEKYYPHPRHDNGEMSSVGDSLWFLFANVILYTGLEFVSVVALNALCWCKLRFLPLYQLAFVLETERALVQSKLVLWFVLLLQFQLYHFGA